MTVAMVPGPDHYHGDQIIDHPNRVFSENERGAIKNYAEKKKINAGRGRRYGDLCICIADSLCHKAETNTPL